MPTEKKDVKRDGIENEIGNSNRDTATAISSIIKIIILFAVRYKGTLQFLIIHFSIVNWVAAI